MEIWRLATCDHGLQRSSVRITISHSDFLAVFAEKDPKILTEPGLNSVWRKAPDRSQHDYVTWYMPAAPPLKGHSPQFSVNVRCGQTAGWTTMPLGVEVGLGPDDFVFDGDPAAPRKKRHSPLPILGPCILWPNGWMD